MLRYTLRRLLASIPTLLLVYTMVFLIAHVTPGSPWDVGTDRPLDPTTKALLDSKFHLDQPIYTQYIEYLAGAVRGDLGPSYRANTMSVDDIVRQFLPVSVELGGAAMILAILVGLPLGAAAALSHSPWLRGAIRAFGTVGVSMPTYVVTSVLIVALGVELGWIPTFGWNGLWSKSAIVPVFSLALSPMAAIASYFRSSMLEVRNLEYVRTARAKGVGPKTILLRHMARNALVPVVTVIGIYSSYILVGSFFVETISGVPGFGRYFVLSVAARDYPVIIGTTLVYAVFIIGINFIVDLAYFFLDPRVRIG